MLKRLLAICLLFSSTAVLAASAKICGFWVIPDSQTGAPESVAYVYEYRGMWYARMVVIYNETTEEISATYLKPSNRATGIPNTPFICGLDFIWGLAPTGSGKYSGSVINPDTGNVYSCTVWYDASSKKLAVRGQWWVFGQTNFWAPIKPSQLPKDVVEGVSKFVPQIPNTSNSSWLF